MKFLAIATICLAAPLALAQMLETSGCYSNPGSLRTQGSYPYQSLGYCQELCMKGARKYMALHDNDQCWCGDSLPEQEDLVSDDKCDTPCTGWPETMCGGTKGWSVYQLDKESTDTSSTSTETSTDSSSTSALRSTSSSAPSTERTSSSASSSATPSVSAAKPERASQSASSSAASPTTSTSAANRRFRVSLFH